MPHEFSEQEVGPEFAERHRFAQREAAGRPQDEAASSPSRAVQQALAELGPGATATEVQQHLAQSGVQVPLALIEQVKAELGDRPSDTPGA